MGRGVAGRNRGDVEVLARSPGGEQSPGAPMRCGGQSIHRIELYLPRVFMPWAIT